MRSQVERTTEEAEKVVRDIRRATRRQYSAEEKVRIVIAGLRGEDSVAELCRKEGINQNLYYRWSKEFLEAGKKRLAGGSAAGASAQQRRLWQLGAARGGAVGETGCLARNTASSQSGVGLIDRLPVIAHRMRKKVWPILRISTKAPALMDPCSKFNSARLGQGQAAR